jgi:hypothetical protein
LGLLLLLLKAQGGGVPPSESNSGIQALAEAGLGFIHVTASFLITFLLAFFRLIDRL